MTKKIIVSHFDPDLDVIALAWPVKKDPEITRFLDGTTRDLMMKPTESSPEEIIKVPKSC